MEQVIRSLTLEFFGKEKHKISPDKFTGVFCPANVRSSIVYAYLLSKGLSDVRIIGGGYSDLTDALKPCKVLKIIKSNGENS